MTVPDSTPRAAAVRAVLLYAALPLAVVLVAALAGWSLRPVPTAASATGSPGPASSSSSASSSASSGVATPAEPEVTEVAARRTARVDLPRGVAQQGVALTPELQPGPRLLGSGDDSDAVRDLQARLAQIAWFSGAPTGYYGEVTASAVSGFQAKREIPVTGEVDQRTMDRLTAMTREPTRDELLGVSPETSGNTAGALDPRCETGRVLCIDKTSSTLRWVVDGAVQMTLDTRFGAEYTPTREGTFSVDSKSRDHVSSLYGSPMPFAMFFSGGQAVHYSSDFAALGYAGASHGCVNVRDYDAIAALFDQVSVGDPVVVYRS